LNQRKKFKAEQSYYEFVRQAFENVPSISKGQSLVDNWHIRLLCDKIQDRIVALTKGEPVKGMVINIPPGTMKSIICTVAPVAWAWIKFPQFGHLGLSNSGTLSTTHCQMSRDIIESNWYQNNWGNVFKLRLDSTKKKFFENVREAEGYQQD